MDKRAAELGELWYDWVGTFLTIGFTIASLYLIALFIGQFKRSALGISILRFAAGFSSHIYLGLVLFFTAAALVTSFLIGMFHDRELVGEAFGYAMILPAVVITGQAAYVSFQILRLISTVLWILTRGCLQSRLNQHFYRQNGGFDDVEEAPFSYSTANEAAAAAAAVAVAISTRGENAV
jgi:hypothetical protein